MMNMKEIFPKVLPKASVSSQKMKGGGKNEGKLIDKAFYCH